MTVIGVAGLLASILATAFQPVGDVDRPWTLEAPRRPVVEQVPGVYWIEAENFDTYGGWVLDTQFAHKMGSGYLLAPGVGKPTAVARTTVSVKAGAYRVWVRTKDWVPEFHPGCFALEINGRRFAKTLGASGRDWSWEDAGSVELPQGPVALSLIDTSGFYARCDAVVLARDPVWRPPEGAAALADVRAACAGEPTGIADGGTYGVVVIGGGPAGVPAALAAARHGAKVALLQDRPVLGGNISSELGVLLNGSSCHPGYREGGIIEEAVLAKAAEARGGKLSFSRVFARLTAAETNLVTCLNQRAYAVEKEGERITAVLTRNPLTGARTRYRAALFVDATGDGWIGRFAGARSLFGREGMATYGETYAPDQPDLTTMSGCILGGYGLPRLRETAAPSEFTTPTWAWPLPKGFYRKPDALRFKWWLEHPGSLDDCADPEGARDALVRIFFAYWGWLKNDCPDEAIRTLAARHELVSLPYMNGRREGWRLVGDYVFTEKDAVAATDAPDSVGHTGWPLDTHDPLGVNNPTGNGSWRKHSPDIPRPVGIPYRILYSVNVPNLFMAGRNVSCSHVGLGTLRVAATCAVMGQAVGTAAAGCLATGMLPREYGRAHIGDLQQTLVRDDQFIPGVKADDPSDVATSAQVDATSAIPGSEPQKVIDGFARTLPATDGETRAWIIDTGFGNRREVARGESHGWVSDPAEALPQTLTVRLNEPKTVSEVRLTFDSDFYLNPIWVLHDLPKTLVRSYAVEVSADGKGWETVADETDNVRRLAVHAFDPQPVAAVRIVVRRTYGDASARIFSVAIVGKHPSPFATDIRTELKRVAAAGGGRVVIPAGEWRTGALELGSNVELHLAEGAKLVFPDDPALYPERSGMYEGLSRRRPSPLIGAFGATNVAVTGKGTLFAETAYWMTNRKKVPRPCFLQFIGCAQVRLEDIRIRNSPNWTMHFSQTDDVLVRGVDSRARGANNDGIDLDSVNGALIEDCYLDQGDDAICMKSGKNAEGRRRGRPTRNVVVRRCTVANGHTLLGVGSELSGGIENVLLEDCTVLGEVWRVLLVKTNRARGGFVRNVTVRNVTAKRAKCAIFGIMSDYQHARDENQVDTPVMTSIENITVEDVTCDEAWYAYELAGDPLLPPRGLTLRNCCVKRPSRGRGYVTAAEDVALENVVADPGPFAVWCDDADSRYACGTEATFTVASSLSNGLAHVRLDNFGEKVLAEFDVDLATQRVFTVRGTRAEPGFLLLTVKCGKDEKRWGASFDAGRIAAGASCPDDFDAFWREAIADYDRTVPVDVKLTPLPALSTNGHDVFSLSLTDPRNRPVGGFLAIPKGPAKGPWPVRVTIPGAGPCTGLPLCPAGKIGLVMNVHYWPAIPGAAKRCAAHTALQKEEDETWQARYPVRKERMRYTVSGIAARREEYYYYGALLAINRAVKWLQGRPEVKAADFTYSGGSQGGGCGLALAALNGGFRRVAVAVPALTAHLCQTIDGREAGWPRLVSAQLPENEAAAVRNAPYFDGVNFAAHITCPIRFTVGFVDTVAPPHAGYAAYNACLSKDKAMLDSVGFGHAVSPVESGELARWLDAEE